MTLTQEIISQMRAKYMSEAETLVKEGKTPPPIYQFVNRNYRPINGHDTEWYNALHGLRASLEDSGYKWQKMCESKQLSSVMDYEYWYPRELTELGHLTPSMDERMAVAMRLDPRYSSENAI